MGVMQRLGEIWSGIDHPFLVSETNELRYRDLVSRPHADLSGVRPGDVVALIGDFDPASVSTFLRLIDRRAIVMPLTTATRPTHPYFLDAALVDVVIADGRTARRGHARRHPLLEELRRAGHAGLVLFSTGTTGAPKAVLHDMELFLKRFETPRPALRTVNFLLFDHIGGLNTLLHTLFNRGVVIAPASRTPADVLAVCARHAAEVLPATPTFLRMMLMSGALPERVPASLKAITYGTERMDQPTLTELCALLPEVDFRQTYGTSELGILRVKSAARDSLFMKMGGEGVEIRVVEGLLQIRSATRMLGYLNAPSPFDAEGWYATGDMVQQQGEYLRVTGRAGEVINVGGLKFMASDVEHAAMEFPGVELVQARPRANPITGQHVELTVQPARGRELSRADLARHLRERLPAHMVPSRIRVEAIEVGHRYKKL